MKCIALLSPLVLILASSVIAHDPTLSDLPQAKRYIQHRSSSYDRTGGNADFRMLAPGNAGK